MVVESEIDHIIFGQNIIYCDYLTYIDWTFLCTGVNFTILVHFPLFVLSLIQSELI